MANTLSIMDIVDRLMNISARLLLTTERQEILSLATEINILATEIYSDTFQEKQKKNVSATLTFTKHDLKDLSKDIKKEFFDKGPTARLIKRISGKNICYEIRFRRKGYKISASSTNIEIAKKKFLHQLQTKQFHGPQKEIFKTAPTTLGGIAEEWFKYREGKVVKTTLLSYRRYYEKHLSHLKNRFISEIRTAELDKAISEATSGRLYEVIRSVANQIFVYAQRNGLIHHNPVSLVPFIRSERKHGTALSVCDEKRLVDKLEGSKVRQSILILLFFGLRPCELSNAHFEGDFLVAQNRKRKGGKIEYKRIPISPVARAVIDLTEPVEPHCGTNHLNLIFKEILPDHTLYDLRHTFSTRCQQFVRQDIVEIWLGDSSTRLIGNTYTHFPDEFMISEMNKVLY